MFNGGNLADKLSVCSFVNYVTSFDFACLTETLADSTFDFNGLFAEFAAPAKMVVSSWQKFRRSLVADQKNCVQICEADSN